MYILKFIADWTKRYFSHPDAIILSTVILIVVGVFLTLGHLLGPVFTAIVIAYLLQWPVNFLERYKIPHSVAVTLVFITFLTFFILALLGLIPMLWQQLTLFINELPEMFARGEVLLRNLPERYPGFISMDQIQTLLDHLKFQLAAAGQILLSYSLSSLPNVFMIIIYLVMVPLLVYFFLMDSEFLLSWVSHYLPAKRKFLTHLWVEIYDQIGNYVAGRVIEIVIVSIACAILFALFHIPYAVLLAVSVGISVIIPYIGAIIVTIPVVILALLQWGLSWQLAYLLITYALILIIDTNIIIPLLFSELIKLHPVAIIVAVLIFGGLLGFWGVFFAIPLAAILKTIINEWPVVE